MLDVHDAGRTCMLGAAARVSRPTVTNPVAARHPINGVSADGTPAKSRGDDTNARRDLDLERHVNGRFLPGRALLFFQCLLTVRQRLRPLLGLTGQFRRPIG